MAVGSVEILVQFLNSPFFLAPYIGASFRPPGFSCYVWGGKKGEFRNWTKEIQACTKEFNSIFAPFKILFGEAFLLLPTIDPTDEPSVFLPLSLNLEELSKLSIESRAADKES